MKKILISCLLLSFFSLLHAQEDSVKWNLELGIRAKKFAGFYWENGLSGEVSSDRLLQNKLHFGANFTTSILGTALFKNAIPTYNIELSALYFWRLDKQIQPLARINGGFAFADYGNAYSSLPSSMPIFSLETGISYQASEIWRLTLSGGLNLITGNGVKGIGTVYPIFGQFSLFYCFK